MLQASSMQTIECIICLEEYNDTNRRPRTLPCAHNFCSPCLQKCIAQGGKNCSVCRKSYIAFTVEDIPINNDIEKLCQIVKLMAENTEPTTSVFTTGTNDSSDEENDFSNGRCPKTLLKVIYFDVLLYI